MKKYKYAFTVFTPTFNRGYTLHRVFESLQKQTFGNFEWLIVDDGSSDNTKQLVENFRKKATFPINYYYQKNSGKHIAFNKAVLLAKGEFFLALDSDDACFPNALERFRFYWNSIPENEKENFSAVTAQHCNESGKIVGSGFSKKIFDSNTLEMQYVYKTTGDQWGFHKTAVLKKFPFPKTENKTIVPESIVWFEISRKYKTRYVSEVLGKNYSDAKSRISKNQDFQFKAEGEIMLASFELNCNLDFFWFCPLRFFKTAIRFSRFSFHKKNPIKKQLDELGNSIAKVLWIAGLPVGFLLYLNDWLENANGPSHFFKKSIARILLAFKISRFFKIKVDELKFWFFPTTVSTQLFVNPKVFSDNIFLKDCLKEGNVVIDVGANIGTITCFAAKIVGKNGKIYSIEPNPTTYNFLIQNVKLNNLENVVAWKIALGAKDKTAFLSEDKLDDQCNIVEKNGFKIEMKKLDSLQITEQKIDLLKIDVEGFEKFVLEGAKKTLQKCNVVYFESFGKNFQKYDYKLKNLIEFFSKNNFFVCKMLEGKKLRILDNEYSSESCENLLAVKNPETFAKEIGYGLIEN